MTITWEHEAAARLAESFHEACRRLAVMEDYGIMPWAEMADEDQALMVAAFVQLISEEAVFRQQWVRVLADLYRCEHGCREGDACIDCGGTSLGNPLLIGAHGARQLAAAIGRVVPERTIGFDVVGRPVVVPPRARQTDPEAWRCG